MWEEMGNNSSKGRYPDAPYQQGRRTNGKNYTEVLTQLLRLPTMKIASAGGTNYAFGPSDNADRPDVDDGDKTLQMQIDDFEADLEGNPADPDAL